jgi:O-antigen/teichoic acid export membrane protein
MNQISSDNKKIAKNTLFLYARMILVTLVTLYTSRVILKALGVEDFGIFTIVGGIVSVLGFIQSVMASAVSRFFMIELGKKNYVKLNEYFRLSIIFYSVMAIVIFILAETIGLWFLNNKILIPEDRIVAAQWVYQFSLFSFITNILTVPYNSIIIARERMNVYAFIGLAEVIMKLIIAFLLFTVLYDKLKVYSILYFATIVLVFLINYLYCRLFYQESKYSWFWSKAMFHEMMGYSVWSLFGSLSAVARNQGINILLGMFYSPAINAARAIAYQINEGINQFSNNFFTAVRPQIIKKYASGDSSDMMNLVFRSSRFSFYLLFILALPILIETQYILNAWLDNPPLNAVLFTRIVVLTSVIDSLGYPLMTAINATGNIKNYQIVTGGLLLLTLPISFVVLKMGYPPESTMYVALIISAAAQASRIIFMKILQNISVLKYVREVLYYVLIVFFLSSIFPLVAHAIMINSNERFFFVMILSIVNSFLVIYTFGIRRNERTTINEIVFKKFKFRVND